MYNYMYKNMYMSNIVGAILCDSPIVGNVIKHHDKK